MSELVDVCESLARVGGQILNEWIGRFDVREKARADLITQADLASQKAIQEQVALRYPDHLFVGEEEGALDQESIQSAEDRYMWIVDPLDGTTNYAHGFPNYAVSVAVVRSGEVLAGAVFQPVTDECFTAGQGGGAWLNGQKICTSNVEQISDALVAASFPAVVQRDSREVVDFLHVLEQAQALRRTGSAALNMCNVAAGRFDAYWASKTKAWDIAAGWLIVTEAGGVVTDLDGGAFSLTQPTPVAAATAALSEEMIQLLGRD